MEACARNQRSVDTRSAVHGRIDKAAALEYSERARRLDHAGLQSDQARRSTSKEMSKKQLAQNALQLPQTYNSRLSEGKARGYLCVVTVLVEICACVIIRLIFVTLTQEEWRYT